MKKEGYDNSAYVRIRINKSESMMLNQLMGRCRPDSDLSNFHGERMAVHTFAIKLSSAIKQLKG